MIISLVGDEWFHADGGTEMMNAYFRNFANMPNKAIVQSQ